jgi:DNA topoisomerase II
VACGEQVSFVNGICTVKGGQHVNALAEQMVQRLMAAVKKKNKVRNRPLPP